VERFSEKVVDQLKYYVYLYICPETDRVFYIGKGRRNRVFSHLKSTVDIDMGKTIRKLRREKRRPRIEFLKYGLTEKEAFLVEATAIDLLGVKNLVNLARGHGSRYGARASVEEVVQRLDAQEVEVTEPALLINISRAFRYGMSAIELYDATRSAWRVSNRRDDVRYAFSVYRGMVQQVYKVTKWIKGGSSMRHDESLDRQEREKGRWEFVGVLADQSIRERYVGKSVSHYFSKGSQNPLLYVNCDKRESSLAHE
jgi:uncharacterized protein